MRTDRRLASFTYGGEEVALIPDEMAREGAGRWVRTMPDGLRAVLELSEPEPGGGTALLRFENASDRPSLPIARVRTLDVTVPVSGAVRFETLDGDSCGEKSFLPITAALSDGDAVVSEPTGGRSSDTSAFPYCTVSCGGRGAVIGIGWTGQWRREIAAADGGLRIAVGLAEADFFLLPGEAVRGPSAVWYAGEGEPAALRRRFRRMCLARFSPLAEDPAAKPPLAIQCFDRYFRKHPRWATVEGQLEVARAAAACGGFDTLWLDAAWFKDGFPCGVGNYTFEKGFAGGLKPLADDLHANGRRFVLWFEPERVYRGSEVWNEHPGMLLRRSDDPDDALFDLSDETARSWLFGTLKAILTENGVDWYRQDFNMEALPFWREHDAPGRRGITEMKYVAGMYELWDRLRAEVPGLKIDNCSSGGRRLDFETCRRSMPLWRSDTGCFPVTEERRVHTWSQNQILGLSEYLPFHSCAVWEPDPYLVRGAMAGGLACAFDILSPEFDTARAGRVIDEVNRTAPFWKKDFFPLTVQTTSEDVWAAWQVGDAAAGAACFFRRGGSAEAEKTFALCGLDPERTYAVTLTDEDLNAETAERTGRELGEGIGIRIPRPEASVLAEYRAL